MIHEKLLQGELDLGVLKRDVRRRGRRNPDFPVVHRESKITGILHFLKNQRIRGDEDIGELMPPPGDDQKKRPRKKK